MKPDNVKLHGHYEAQCTGPVESRRAEYVEIRDQMLAAEAAGETYLASVLKNQLSAIPTEEKWADSIENVVTTVGKNDMLDKYFKGAAYIQTIRMGLKGTGTAVVGDTQASHAGWLEQGLANAPTYTGNRPSITMGTAVAGVSTAPAQAFAITSSGTVFGLFINNGGSATKDDTTGILYSAGDFSGGSKVVANGDTINGNYSMTLT